jgi:hypothetical protein
MTDDRIEAITTLLAEAGEAHGRYEESELGGVYDTDWPAWYAAYAVDHGLGGLLDKDVTAGTVAAFLASTNAELETTVPKPTESWAAWTARRISADL